MTPLYTVLPTTPPPRNDARTEPRASWPHQIGPRAEGKGDQAEPRGGSERYVTVARCYRVRPHLDELPPAMSAAAVLLPSRSAIASGRPPSHCPAAPLEKSRSSALPTPHSARRRAGQAAGGSTHHLPRQMSRLLLSTQSAGRRPGGRRTRHRVTHPRRSPPRAELSLLARSPSGTPPLSHLGPASFPPG